MNVMFDINVVLDIVARRVVMVCPILRTHWWLLLRRLPNAVAF